MKCRSCKHEFEDFVVKKNHTVCPICEEVIPVVDTVDGFQGVMDFIMATVFIVIGLVCGAFIIGTVVVIIRAIAGFIKSLF